MADTSIGQIGLDLVVNQNQFNKQMSGIQGMAKKAGLALAAAFSVKKIVEFGKACIELGSDLAEVQNVVDVTFPAMTSKVDKFAKSAAASFGLSETMAKRFTGTFGAMAKAFGFSEQQAYDMSTALTGLAGDVASFYNITQDEAYTKLKSVFTGETESLKDLGVVMTQTALDSYALANGYGKTVSAMSEAEKVALRYAFVQDQLSAAQGDFARTSDSWANQVRLLSLQFDSLKATIGQGLINVFLPIIRVINSLLGKLSVLAEAFKSFTELITGNKAEGGSGIQSTAADLTAASGAADDLADSTEGIGDAAKKAAKELNLMNFDQIQKVKSQDSAGSGGSGTSLGGAVDFGSLAQGETVIDDVDNKFTKMFQNIQEMAKPTTDALKRLWTEGLAKFGNFTWGSLKGFYNGFLVPVGKWSLGTGIPRFVDALNNGLSNVDYEKIQRSLQNLWKALTPFAINIGEGLLWFWENVLVPIGTWTANEVVPRFLNTLSISIGILNNVITALQPLFEWFWSNVLQPLAEWGGEIFLKAWDGINAALRVFSDWCENNPAVIQAITVMVTAFFGAWQVGKIAKIALEIAEYVVNAGGLIAALTAITSGLTANTVAWASNMTAKLADKAETVAIIALYVKDFVIGLAKSTAELAKQAAQFAINTAAKIADTAAQVAMTAATTVWNGVCALATAATTAFGVAVAFLTSPIGIAVAAIGALIAAGVLIWKNWDTIKEKSSEIWGSITQNIKGAINTIIGGINGLIRGIVTGVNTAIHALNKLSFDVPSWVPGIGGKKFGFNLQTITAPQIPYLAQGAFVKANTPRLAVIGDNRTQGEIVAPEDKMQAMVDLAVRKAGGNVSKEDLERIINNAIMRVIAALSALSFNVDGETLANAEIKNQEGIDRRYNPVKVF